MGQQEVARNKWHRYFKYIEGSGIEKSEHTHTI